MTQEMIGEKQPTVSHWSKDFVEHLRTIHFALMTLSGALVIVLLSTGNADLAKAFAQAAQIERLLSRWKDVQVSAYENATRTAQLQNGGTVNVSSSSAVFEWDAAAKVFVRGTKLVGASLELTPQQFATYEDWKFPESKMAEAPETLGEFRSWWNQLNQGISVVVPNFSSRDLRSCNAKISGRPAELMKCSQTVSQFPSKSRGFRWIVPKPSDQEIYIVWDIGPPLTKESNDVYIEELRTSHELRTVNIGERFLSGFHSDWHSGTFETSFRELSVVSNQLQDLSITAVRERIQEMQSKADERFEAFGLKIPAGQIARWGICLLLAVQFYFWVHLHELTRKLHPEDPGWEVAWIGVYSSKAALIATMSSSTFLPALAAVLLAWRFWSGTAPGSHIFWTALALAALIADCAIALATAFKLLRLRRCVQKRS